MTEGGVVTGGGGGPAQNIPGPKFPSQPLTLYLRVSPSLRSSFEFSLPQKYFLALEGDLDLTKRSVTSLPGRISNSGEVSNYSNDPLEIHAHTLLHRMSIEVC